jgi:hypothetical protein
LTIQHGNSLEFYMKTLRKPFVLIALTTIFGLTHASGGGEPEDSYVARFDPDVDLSRFSTGEIGILQPTYARTYLYSAWRSIVNGVKREPSASEIKQASLDNACCTKPKDWSSTDGKLSETYGPGLWLKARKDAVRYSVRVEPEIFHAAIQKDHYYDFHNCPVGAWEAAAKNLQVITKRQDATQERVEEWVKAQDAVFEFCGSNPQQKVGDTFVKVKPMIPSTLSKTEPAYWQQWRQYQIAAAYFYSSQYDKSGKMFAEIGYAAGHPMQAWGKYLALRSNLRHAVLIESASLSSPGKEASEEVLQNWGRSKIARFNTLGAEILGDPALALVHDATRATLRSAAYNLIPEDRFEEVSKYLDDYKADPYLDDSLGDWKALADKLEMGIDSDATDQMRQKHAFFDWIQSVKACSSFPFALTSRSTDEEKHWNKVCLTESADSVRKWKAARVKNSPLAKAWLVSALMNAANPGKDVIAAAQAVPESAPEYLTVQYHLIRIQRGLGETEALKNSAKKLLSSGLQSASARNLMRRELFAASSSLAEAAKYMGRETVQLVNFDTDEKQDASPSVADQLDGDAIDWLSQRIGLAEMLELAGTGVLDKHVRSSLAGAAWWRAHMLGKPDIANTAAELTGKLVPGLSARAKAFVASTSEYERRHILVVASLLHGLSPNPSANGLSTEEQKPQDATASAWCSIMRDEKKPSSLDARLLEPVGPKVFASGPDEMAKSAEVLGAIPTATTYVGRDVLDWVKSNPSDKELPWLLYVTVQSTRGGCLDAGNGALSKEAFTVLHKRFPRSAWTANTPVYYP